MPKERNTEFVVPLLDFLRRAEALKSTLRTTWTRTGRQESTAAHSWRLSLLALLAAREYPELDARRIVELSILHDLGEAIHGDIPAPEQHGPKDTEERADFIDLLRPLPAPVREELLARWEEYEYAQTPEARLVKALDKLETLLQQAQGDNPPDFDYAYNLDYGTRFTQLDAFTRALREAVDDETRCRLLSREWGREPGEGGTPS